MACYLAGVVGWSTPAERRALSLRSLNAQAKTRHDPAVHVQGQIAFTTSDPYRIQRPLHSERYSVVADIRIDNRSDVLRSLGGPHDLVAASDEVILLRAWQQMGERTFDFILGEYACAIFDHEENRLILARDPSGSRPLFFAIDEPGTAFATMPSGLRALAVHKPNLAYLAATLLRPTERESTDFEGISRVRPGEVLEVSERGVRRRYHWQPTLYCNDVRSAESGRSDAEYVDHYRSLLDAAVSCRLPAEGMITACQLSSGWDSSGVTGTAAQLGAPGLIAFTAVPLTSDLDDLPRGRFADEAPFAARTAALHKIRHEIVKDVAPLFDVMVQQTLLTQAPLTSPFNITWWAALRERARGHGVRTFLTGEMGNFTLNAGGIGTLSAMVQQRQWGTWWREARSVAANTDARWRGIMMKSFGDYLPTDVTGALERLARGKPLRPSNFLRRDWIEMEDELPARLTFSSDAYAGRLEILRLSDPGTVRRAAFEQAGIEELDPTADRRIMEFSLLLPPDQMLRNGESKPMARAALADRVPSEILNLRQRGMQSADWYLHFDPVKAMEVVEEISATPSVQELLDLTAIREAIRTFPTHNRNGVANVYNYRFGLGSALAAGMFVHQFST